MSGVREQECAGTCSLSLVPRLTAVSRQRGIPNVGGRHVTEGAQAASFGGDRNALETA